MSMKNSTDTIGNGTHDLPACSAVPQATALQKPEFNRSDGGTMKHRGALAERLLQWKHNNEFHDFC